MTNPKFIYYKSRTMNNLFKTLLLGLFILHVVHMPILNAQILTQTIRGKIMDTESKTPLPGANVIVLDSPSFLGASTDVNGEFRIENVPLGRVSLSVSYLGYENSVIPNILVTSGKEVVLEIALRESLVSMEEVVVTANGDDKSKIVNEMALVSARGFTVEETKRYAGSFNDPARMVAGFAGVTTDPSGDNSIIVRGNSPKGIQWRLEGIEIPNPNHFSEEGATGGPINALNSKMLANSEFYTGAFAPEYGNALSGVFDMHLRKGNNEKREYSFSLGILGTEATLEGPFKEDRGASYLLNYRYSTLSLLDGIGLVDYGGIPTYQDLSFKVFLPTKSLGTFSIFGLGGRSNIIEEAFDEENEDIVLERGDYAANMGVVGVTQFWAFNAQTYLQNSISVSTNGSGFTSHEPTNDGMTLLDDLELNKTTFKATTTLNHKFSPKHALQAGLLYTHHDFSFYYSYLDKADQKYLTEQDRKGDAGHYQGFISWKYRPLQELSFVSGLHAQGTTINGSKSIEPRASVRWEFHPRQALAAGFGIHGKMASLPDYYSLVENESGDITLPNKSMGFSKAAHYVIGYENRLTNNLFLKAEAYYQNLFDIPVENKFNSTYSLLNSEEGFTNRALTNDGSGENIGIELTLERYFADNYYFLFTTSLYDSKYKALDGVKRNTRFNGNYAGNFLFGKEFELQTAGTRKKVISLNTKISLLGARRYTPVDVEQSKIEKRTVFEEDKAFSKRAKDIFIANFAIAYRIDNRKISQEIKLDVQNATNNQGEIWPYYNRHTDKVEFVKQLSLLPVVMYTVNF